MIVGDEATASLREMEYSRRDFERVRRLIHARAGIALADSKQDMVYGRLARRLRLRGLSSFQAYLDELEGDASSEEWQGFVNALTTNLTGFFREPHHFERLAQLLRRHQGEPLLLWCAAASTGEEPYSIAITAAEVFGTLKPPVTILATDIDTQVLDTAARGVYPVERLEKVDPQRRKQFFLKGTGAAEGQCRVIDELRDLIRFRQLNLLEPRYPMHGPFQAVFCRNVMIYFDKPTQYRILARVMPLLAGDGLFFAGHSESFFHATDLLRPLGGTVYGHAVN
jgi:chemotaxis protein methyltransferase CheR